MRELDTTVGAVLVDTPPPPTRRGYYLVQEREAAVTVAWWSESWNCWCYMQPSGHGARLLEIDVVAWAEIPTELPKTAAECG